MISLKILLKADYTVNALDFINEFKLKDSINPASNKKYSEKIIIINGRVTSVETPDSTINLKITDAEGAYISFAFQQKDQTALKKVKEGDSVSIKGSCNGANFSGILQVPSITFKRCSLNK
jgi:Cu/Ag efflux protein CusF